MSRAWKVVAVVAVLLLLPVGAFAVGALTAPERRPSPRPEITITERPSPSANPEPNRAEKPGRPPQQPRAGVDDERRDERRDDRRERDRDDVRVVKPRPTQVDGDDDGDDDADDDSRDDDSDD